MKSAQVWWQLISLAHKQSAGMFRNIRNGFRKPWILAGIKLWRIEFMFPQTVKAEMSE